MSALAKEVGQRLREVGGAHAFTATTAVFIANDAQALTAAVRVCAETATPFRVRSDSASSVRAPAGGVVISVEKLTDVAVRGPGLTLRAGAGAALDAVRAAAAKERLAVLGLDGVQASTAGSVVARGLLPRRSLTGVEAVLATGETVAFGGGMLKDVVGYDVPAVLLGSGGRLAVVCAATFRLEPAGARTVAGVAPGTVDADPAIARAFDPQGLLRSPA